MTVLHDVNNIILKSRFFEADKVNIDEPVFHEDGKVDTGQPVFYEVDILVPVRQLNTRLTTKVPANQSENDENYKNITK